MKETLIISGLGRCGTSLSMMMLDAAGYPVFSRPLAYESDENNKFNVTDDFLESQQGKAVKIINPYVSVNENDVSFSGCKVIWMRRNLKEQAKSQIKLAYKISGIEPHYDTKHVKEVANRLKEQEHLSLKFFMDRHLIVSMQSFEKLLEHPRRFLENVQRITGVGLDIDKGASMVVERGSENYPVLMEDLLKKSIK